MKPIAPPYALDALNPHLSGETLYFIVERILPRYAHYQQNDGQCPYAKALYHHAFWLHHLTDNHTPPSDFMMARIYRDFGSFEKLTQEFLKHAHRLDVRFIWLVSNKGCLSIIATEHQSILDTFYTPLFACNLWEHAYYLDYRDQVDDYITAHLNHLIDWQKVEFNYLNESIWQPKTK